MTTTACLVVRCVAGFTKNNKKMKKKSYYASFAFMLSFAALPAMLSAQTYERIGMEGVKLLGTVTFGDAGVGAFANVGLFEFPYESNYVPATSETPLISGDFAGGSTYHDGKIYCNSFNDETNIQAVKPVWKIYDAETYELLYERELNDNCENTTSTLAYDPTTDKIYGYVVDYTDTHFVEIDPETGEMVRIGGALDRNYDFPCLACNSAGQLYAVTLYSNYATGESDLQLSKVRKSDGRFVKVGTISCDNLMGEDYLVYTNYDQALFFDNSSGDLFWFMSSSSTVLNGIYTPLFKLNTLNAHATLVSYIGQEHHISGAYFLEPDMDVPAVIEDFEFNAVADGANEGTFAVTMPSVTYGGTSLDGATLGLRIEEGETVLLDTKAVAGEEYVSDGITFADGFHTLSITVSNETGNSPTVEREIYVGYDTPKAPQNVVLTNDGLTTTLTWEPPTEGVNGRPINSDNFTYTVVRYPYEVTVAEGIKGCSFTETHPAEMTRYIYTVTAVDGERVGEFSYSNALILGEPLRPPYGGIFAGPEDMYNYYTIIDNNSDGFSWGFDSNTASAVYIYSPFQQADDWIIAPPIIYDAETTYELTFKAYSSLQGYPEAMQIMLGRDRTPESMTQLLLDIPEVPCVDEDNPVQQFKTEFTTDEEGIYYYGLHAVSPKYCEFLYVFDIKVYEKGTDAVDELAEEPDVIVVASDGRLCVGNPQCLDVEVYDSRGIMVHHSSSDNVDLSLDRGLYIVRANGKVYKTMVR